jgi:hypothetical protein
MITFGRRLGSKDKKKRVRNLGAKIVTYKGVRYRLSASKPSSNKNKKRVREVTNLSTGLTKKIHYGFSPMQNFGNGKNNTHRSEKRRSNYLVRSAGIRDTNGNLTKDNPLSPNYFSRRDLW